MICYNIHKLKTGVNCITAKNIPFVDNFVFQTTIKYVAFLFSDEIQLPKWLQVQMPIEVLPLNHVLLAIDESTWKNLRCNCDP